MIELTTFLKIKKQRIDTLLKQHLPKPVTAPKQLHSAMHYAVLNGGKRIRPLLVYACGEAFGANGVQLDTAAIAVELIHCYSLVHDDLPALDNDATRRGKPACHKKFTEATAILAGDALCNLAIELIVKNSSYPPQAKASSFTSFARG